MVIIKGDTQSSPALAQKEGSLERDRKNVYFVVYGEIFLAFAPATLSSLIEDFRCAGCMTIGETLTRSRSQAGRDIHDVSKEHSRA